MSAADLHVEVQGGEIIVTLPGSIYSVTYFKSPNALRQVAPYKARSACGDDIG
jgi:hypothetical protein